MRKEPSIKQYYTTNDIARIIGVKPATVCKWANEGYIKVIRTIGGHRRIPLAEFDRVLKEYNIEL